jgi:lactoylglutathione lyase
MTELVETDTFVELHVPNFKTTIDFYSKLGFEVVWQTSSEEGYLVMRRGRSVLNFYGGTEKVYEHPYFGRFPRHTVRSYAVEIVIPIDNIEAFFKTIRSNLDIDVESGRIVQELELKPWGKKDFRIVDPFGFYLRFTERINWLIP